MANQQLIDYIGAQRAKGVPRDAIAAALTGAGWNQGDVTAAMDATFGAATLSASPVASPSAVAASKPAFFQTAPITKVSPFTTSTAPATPLTPVTTFDPASVTVEHHGLGRGAIIGMIVVVVLILGGLGYWYFFGSSSAPAPAATSAGTQPSQATVDSLTQANNDLTLQKTQLTAQVTDLENQLSIFAATTTKDVPLTIRGTLAQSTTTKVFTLTTSHNIVLTVLNSKDAKVSVALTPLVGQSTELTGTHAPGSTMLKVTAVNGTSLEAAPAAATSSPATAPAAGTSSAPAPAAPAPHATTSGATTSTP